MLHFQPQSLPFLNKSKQESPPDSVSARFLNLSSRLSCNLPSISVHRNSSHRLTQKPFLKQNDFSHTEPSFVSANNFGRVKIYAANSRIGLARKRNEDRVQIILNLKRPDSIPEEQWPRSSFFGLFAGHGGKTCASFLKENLHKAIFGEENFPFRIKKTLNNAFEQTDKQFLGQCEENSEFSGATALVALIIGNKCFVAGTGNSRALLSAEGGGKVLQLSVDHTPLDEAEKNRISDHGGKISTEYVMDEDGTMISHGYYKVIPWNLSVSRSFGDAFAKCDRLGGNPNIIIPKPHVKGFRIDDSYDFILLCSAGVFDRLSNKEVIDCVWKGIHECKDGSAEDRLNKGVLELITQSLSMQNQENITVIVIGFKSLTTTLSSSINL
jgi:protein phosphatase PTC2/3